jgi:polyphenol oxidase
MVPSMLQPVLADSFEWIRAPWGPALRCRTLQAHADHCFTTRQPALPADGLSPGDGWHRVALAFGVPVRSVVRLHQVHGVHAVIVRRVDRLPDTWGTGDASATDHPGVALSVKVADCVPILLADTRTGAVAAVHAGWRGTAAGVAGAAVQAMTSAFGSHPADLVAAIGPSIGPCCYRVGEDVRAVFGAGGRWAVWIERWFTPSPRGTPRHGVPGTPPPEGGLSLFLDAWAANADQLSAAGVPISAVHVSRLCTSCHRDVFHSYRVDGVGAGRMVGVVRMRRR